MRLHPPDLRRPAGAIAVLATAGLVLTGCGGSGSGSGSTSGANSGSTSAAGNSSSAASNGGGGSTSTVSSASAPFPIAVGNTWTYKTVTPGIGSNGKTVNKIRSVKQVSSGQEVDMTAAITAAGTTTHTSSYYIFEPNGAISVPFSQFSSANSGTQVKLISGGIFWPPESALQSGQTTHSTLKIKYTINGVKKVVTAHIAVKGSGSQSVTVPAGTYDATVVNMTMSEKVEGYNVSVDVRTWLANGIGPVKTEAILGGIAGNKVASEDELVSFHKG
jgi:hypothetical protein